MLLGALSGNGCFAQRTSMSGKRQGKVVPPTCANVQELLAAGQANADVELVICLEVHQGVLLSGAYLVPPDLHGRYGSERF